MDILLKWRKTRTQDVLVWIENSPIGSPHVFEHVVPSWWCWGRLGGVTLLEEVHHWGYITWPYLQFALSTSCLQFEDANAQFSILVAMPATCCYVSPPSWTLLLLKPEA